MSFISFGASILTWVVGFEVLMMFWTLIAGFDFWDLFLLDLSSAPFFYFCFLVGSLNGQQNLRIAFVLDSV